MVLADGEAGCKMQGAGCKVSQCSPVVIDIVYVGVDFFTKDSIFH